MSLQPGHHEGRRVLPGGVSPASFVVMTGVGVFFAILPVVVKAPWWQGILAALLVGDWVVADASDPRHRREGSGLTAAYLQWHLERGVLSLRHVDRTTSHPTPSQRTG